MIYRKETIPFFQFEILSRDRSIQHFVTTRVGPAHHPPKQAFNLSVGNGQGAKREHGKKNRKALTKALRTPWMHITTVNQVHGNHIKLMSQSHGNRLIRDRIAHDDVEGSDVSDAMVTDQPGNCIMVLTADCVPILLYDPIEKVVGAVHAGWKGTLLNIAGRVVEVFVDTFQSKPKNILAGIGPSIGPCCFEVGPEVTQQFSQIHGGSHIIPAKNGCKEKIDLWRANARQLMKSGVRESHIEHANLCTCHHTDTFFSYRCGADKAGRFGTGIFLV
jgi:YfiH family protein